MTLLLERLRPVLQRRAGLAVAVIGEAGAGKTHSARMLLARAPCRSASAHAGGGVAAWAAGLPRAARAATWADRNIERLCAGDTLPSADAVAAIASRLKSLAPVILHLEDVHEADQQDIATLTNLGESVRRARGTALLVTSRNDLPAPFLTAALEPLTAEACTQMLEAEAGSLLPPEAARWIHDRAAGNPLYSLEYFRYLARLGHLWNDGRTWRWRPPPGELMPVTVEALVEQRLQQACAVTEVANAARDEEESRTRTVLEAHAYLDADARSGLLAKVANVSESELASAHQRLTQARVLADQGGPVFAHPLFREVALRTLDPLAKREFARRAVDALAGDPLGVARYVEAAELPPDRALATLKAAAEVAEDALAAARMRAVASRLATGEERARLALAAANVLHHHDLAEAQPLLELAVEHTQTRPDALLNLVNLLAMTGRQCESDELAERLTESAYPGIPPAALKLSSRNLASDHRGAWDVWEANPELASTNSPELLRAAGTAALATGRVAEAAELIERCRAATEDPAMLMEMLSLRALLQFHGGDPTGADATMAELFDMLDTLDSPRMRAAALLNRAAFLRQSGRYAEMGECLDESLRIRQGGGDGKAYAFAMVSLADLRIEQGRFDQADDLLTEAIGTLEIYGPSRQLTVARTAACKLGIAQDTSLSRLAALRQVERALVEARRGQNSRLIREVLIDAALAHGVAGDPSIALRYTEESAGLAEAAGDSPADAYREAWARGLAQQALGQVEDAEQSLVRAFETAGAVEGAIEMHKIGLQVAFLRNDGQDARTRYEWFRERGLEHGAMLATQLFPGLAAPAVERAETASRAERPVLSVLGPMRFMDRGSDGDAAPVRGEKRRLLLAALLEARVSGRNGLSKLDLLDLLYPGQDEAKAAVSLRQLVLVTRRELGANLIYSTEEGYALGDCDSDLDQFLERPVPGLWRGQYLGGLFLGGQLRDTLHAVLARHVEDLIPNNPREAARLGLLLHEAEPYRFDYLTACLQALEAAGNRRNLESLYENVRAQAAEFGEKLPERWQEFLAEAARGRVHEHEPGQPRHSAHDAALGA